MKKHSPILITTLLLLSCTPIESSSAMTRSNKTFSDAHFDDASYVYDGQYHRLGEVFGVPEGTSITYTGRESYVDVGTYPASALLEKEGYDSITLTANLTITPTDFSNISFPDLEVEYDGLPHEITCMGVPEFATVRYSNNVGTEVGIYEASATITAPNYIDLTLRATLTILTPLLTFDEAKMEDFACDYDGKSHTIEPSGLPEGAKVTYKGTYQYVNVGTYTISCTVSKEGYVSKDLFATLTINNATLSGVTFEDLTVLYDGQSHSITVSNAPTGSTVTYSQVNGTGKNTFKDVGSYEVKAEVSLRNYNPLTLTATLNIIKGSGLIATDPDKSAYVFEEPLMWDPVFSELMKGNYTAWAKSGYWDSDNPDVKNDYSPGRISASDGVSFCYYYMPSDSDLEDYGIYVNCGDDIVCTEIDPNYDIFTQERFPAEAIYETFIQRMVAEAFVGLQEYSDGRIINGVDLDDYYGSEGRAEVFDNHFVVTLEHPRNLDSGVTRYFYEIYDFYNVGNTKLNIPKQYYLAPEEIEELGTYYDFYLGGVRYGIHLVSTYNSPLELMAHVYLYHWLQLIVAPGVHYVLPDVYGDIVVRVVHYYYTEREYNYNMGGYILNVYFNEDGLYQGEYASYGEVVDKTSRFVSRGGTVNYYDDWANAVE